MLVGRRPTLKLVEIRLKRSNLGVIRRHAPHEYSKPTAIQLSGFGEPTAPSANDAQGTQSRHKLQMARAEVLLLYAQCTSQPHFGTRKISLSSVNRAQAAECGRYFQVSWAVAALEDLETMLEQRPRFLVASSVDEDAGKRGAVSSGGGVIRTELRLVNPQRCSCGRFTLGWHSSSVSQPA